MLWASCQRPCAGLQAPSHARQSTTTASIAQRSCATPTSVSGTASAWALAGRSANASRRHGQRRGSRAKPGWRSRRRSRRGRIRPSRGSRHRCIQPLIERDMRGRTYAAPLSRLSLPNPIRPRALGKEKPPKLPRLRRLLAFPSPLSIASISSCAPLHNSSTRSRASAPYHFREIPEGVRRLA
jgi:hypothetical protein